MGYADAKVYRRRVGFWPYRIKRRRITANFAGGARWFFGEKRVDTSYTSYFKGGRMNATTFQKPIGFSVFILIMMLQVLAGCSSGELTRSAAEKLILADEKYPKEITKEFKMGEFRTGPIAADQYFNYGGKLLNSGLGSFSHNGGGEFQFVVNIALTDKGREFARGNVFDCERGDCKKILVLSYVVKFGEVTGIAYLNAEKTVAQVEYTVIYEPTPFALLKIPGANNFEAEPTKAVKATYRLFDDGWRKEARLF